MWISRRLIAIAAGVVLVLLIAARIVMSSAGANGDIAVDTTGATADQSTPVALTTTPTDEATPASTTIAPSPTPLVVQIQGTAVSIEAKPLVLLNPSTVRQGSSIGVAGSGFEAGATVDIYLKQQESDQVDPLTFIQVDKSGGFGGVTLTVPDSLTRGTFLVEASQRQSDVVARATAIIGGGSPQVKLGTQAAKAGDSVQLSATDFSPDEDISVYWNDLATQPVGTLHTDETGVIRQGSITVPFGAVGNNGLVFIGDKSQSPVTIPFQLLNLYPSVDLSSYAIKPDNVLTFSGKDFGPGEQIAVYLNNPDIPALTTVQADDTGGFGNSTGFLVPFGLKGKQTLIFMGKQSRAPTTASFDTLPYTPSVQPSTYGGRPGTILTFYATGFARDEIVHAVVGRGTDSAGEEVSCFRTDAQGNAAAAGSYVIPGDAPTGQLLFNLVGSRSKAIATAALDVIASDVPVDVQPQQLFTCELTDGPDAASGRNRTGATGATGNQRSCSEHLDAGTSPPCRRAAEPQPTTREESHTSASGGGTAESKPDAPGESFAAVDGVPDTSAPSRSFAAAPSCRSAR